MTVDDVASSAGEAADQVALCSATDPDAAERGPVQDDRARLVGPDDVAGDRVAVSIENADVIVVARGDDVAFESVVDAVTVGADEVLARPVDNSHAVEAIAERGQAVGAEPDVVALDAIVGSAGA